jgi:aspartate aminotransferase-like enzyme
VSAPKKTLFTPGPTNVPDFVLQTLGQDIIHHRMGDYKEILFKVTDQLKQVFQTNEEVLILTASGTGSMESSVVNLFSKGERVLVINTGFFGDRFTEIATTYGLDVLELKYEWGKSYDLDEVKKTLQAHQDIKGIFMTHHETATGVVNDVSSIGDLVKDNDRLLITDCISGMIVHPFQFDEWHVDCAVASSQKGFLLPPGLAFVALSQKAKDRMKISDLPKYYWDYKKYFDYLKKGQNPFTPAISIVLALNTALDFLLEKGIDQIVKEQEELRVYTEKRFLENQFKLFIQDETIRGNVLVPVQPTTPVDINKLTEVLDQKFNLSVSKGQGKYTDHMLRVGIIGEITKQDIDDLIEKINVIRNK